MMERLRENFSSQRTSKECLLWSFIKAQTSPAISYWPEGMRCRAVTVRISLTLGVHQTRALVRSVPMSTRGRKLALPSQYRDP